MLDIKWKNSRRKWILTILVLIAVTFLTMAFFPSINRRGEENYEALKEQYETEGLGSANEQFMTDLYIGCYVLYKETIERENGGVVSNSELFIKEYPQIEGYEEEEIKSRVDQQMNDVIERWTSEFEKYRSYVDYAVLRSEGETNTNRHLEEAGESVEKLQPYYREIFAIRFNENGIMEVEAYYAKIQDGEDEIIKTLGKIDRSNILNSEFQYLFSECDKLMKIKKPQNFEVVFGTSRNNLQYSATERDYLHEYWMKLEAYENAGAGLIYYIMGIFLIAFAFFMGNKKMWEEHVMVQRPGKCYFMEAAILGIFCILCMHNELLSVIWQQEYYENYYAFRDVVQEKGVFGVVMPIFRLSIVLLVIYAAWYASVCFIRPVFSLGIREYIRQYSITYLLFIWCRKKKNKLMYEMEHIDLEDKSTSTILKIVAANFIVLVVLMMFWFGNGIIPLMVYSVILFFLIKKCYKKIRKDYKTLLQGMNRIAEGDLNTVISEDLGIFEPFRGALARIREGFKKAVDDEVKSQHMKTELITNISHDLKTPLTAITTYIELLKKGEADEKERNAYIEILEKKSLRLKVLIEDLFEISKVSSNNIVLNMVELDVVNLLKQVSIEFADKMQEQGMKLRLNVPEEKVLVLLDNQKTYRIFENLFVNICKYAMPGSRVYAEVKVLEDTTMIILKNISADELNFNAEDITERFVRGDSSRNTEGSGLGLAIVKSFTEAQGGKFRIEIDNDFDLFKAVVEFPRLRESGKDS